MGQTPLATSRTSPTESLQLGTYRRLLEEISDYIYFVRLTAGAGTETIHGAGCEAITGYTAAELQADQQLWIRMVPPEDRPLVEEQLAHVRAGHSTPAIEHRLRRKDGELRWVLSIVLPQFAPEGRLIGHDGLLRDVTARKQAEERVAQNQQLLVGLVEAAMDAIISIDLQQRIILFNPAAEKMFGLTAAEALGEPLERLIPQRYRAAHAEHIRRFAQTGTSSRRMGELGRLSGLRASGEEFPIEASISLVDLGTEQVLTVILRDISQRVRAESDTAALAAIVTSSDDAIISKTLSGHITSWNAGAERVFGYTAQEAVGRHISFLIPPDRLAEEPRILTAVGAGEQLSNYESQRIRKDGQRIDVSLTISPVLDAAGRVTGISKIARDITERKQAEERLRTSEEKYRRFFANILEPAAICRVERDAEGTMVDWVPLEMNTAAISSFQSAYEKLLGHLASEFLEPEDAAERVRRLRDVMATRQGNTYEARFQGIDFLTTMFPLDDEIFVITGIDIKARKQAEAELRNLNQELEQRVASKTREVRLLAEAVANLSEGVLITDAQIEAPGPSILFVNQAMTRITGYTVGEFQGESPRMLQGELTERGVLDRMKRELSVGRSCQCELTNYRKNGEPYEAELFITPLYDAGGERTNFIAIHRDVSQRKQLEQHVRDAASDEQRRIGHELHDGTGQQLTGLSLQAGALRELMQSFLKREAQRGPGDPEREAALVRMRDLTAKLCGRLEEAQRHVQDLSRGIMPVHFDGEGLRSALEELASATSAPPYVRCTFECPAPVVVADTTMAGNLYRIAQEAVSNGLRHSRADKLSIRLVQHDEQLVLEVSDNGTGIEPAADDKSATAGMGLRIMEYRAGIIGGALEIERGERGGTKVRCTVYAPQPYNTEEQRGA